MTYHVWANRGYRRVLVSPLVLLIVLALLAGCSQLLPGKATPTPAQYTPAVVNKGTVEVTVQANGAVATPGQVVINVPIGALLTALQIAPGEQVKAGQSLGTLDTTALDAAVAQAKLTLAAAASKLEAMRAGPRPEMVTQARAALSQAQASLRADEAKLQALQAGPAATTVAPARAVLDQARVALGADRVQAAGKVSSAAASVADARAKLGAAEQSAPLLIAQAHTDIQKAKDALFAAQTSRDGTCGNSPGYQCQAANAQVNAATDDVASAQTRLKQQLTLNAATLDTARAAVAQAEVALTNAREAEAAGVAKDQAAISAAQAALTLAGNPAAPADLAQAQAAIERDQAAIAAATAALSLAEHPFTPADLQPAQATVAQAQSAVAIAEAQVQHATLASPIDGVVVTVPVTAGTYLSGGSTVATLSPINVVAVTANVSEFDVRKIALHDTATVNVDGFPGSDLTGTVTGINQLPLTVQGVVFYPVTITIQNPKNLILRPGMTVQTTIVTMLRQNVLVLPNAAIGQLNGSEAVLVPVAGAAPTWKPVQVGAQNDKLTEIQSGLALGATVLIPGATGPAVPAAAGTPNASGTPASAPPGIGVPATSDQQGAQ